MKRNDLALKCALVFFVVILAIISVKIWIENSSRMSFINDYRQVVNEQKYMAHALGGVDEKKYTNSKEAIENALARGFQLFEADVILTSDDKLVLFHRWNEWNYKHLLSDREFDSQKPAMMYEDFMKTKIMKKYVTMDFADLADYMKENEKIYVMLDFGKHDRVYMDKVYNEILKTIQDKKLLDRLIVGGYDTSMIEAAQKKYDFKLYNLYWDAEEKRSDTRIDTKEEFLKYCRQNGITSLSTSVETYELEKSEIEYLRNRGLIVYVFTENDEKKAQELLNEIDVVGTDFISL